MKNTNFLSILLVLIGMLLAATTQAQLSGKEILIDPGHGGSDPGALGINGSTYPDEADLVLDCGLEIRNRLQAAGATVYMTRTTDATVGLYTRRDFANSYNPDAYFSVHLNSATASALGTETWYYHNSTLASNIQNKLIENMGRVNRGIKQNGWAVLTCNSWIPACLTEGLFISNTSDWNYINTTAGFDSWVTGHEHGLYAFWGITPPSGKPSVPNLRTVVSNNCNKGLTVTWAANPESNIAGYRLYYTEGDNLSNWILAANESTLNVNVTTISFNSPSEFLNSTTADVYYFRLTAVNDEGVESDPSDIYSRSSLTDGSGLPKVLIVDGFDRTNGSYAQQTHSFNTDYFKAVRDNGSYVISSAANDPVAEGAISLADYNMVIWFVGDESTVKETFSSYEQTKIKNYLEAGGKLLVSGSEIGWDLYEKGSTDDQSFYTNYLKASYQNDGGSGRSPATGSGDFSGVSLSFGLTYTEDYPDEIAPTTGGNAILNYANSATGGISYNGIIGSGTSDASVVYIAFPLETVSNYNAKIAFMGKVLEYFNDGTPVASFAVSGLPAAPGETVSFDASGSSDPDGTIQTYSWDFGDGATTTGVSVNHAYSTNNTFTVTLTVTDNDGKTAQANQTFEITDCPAPGQTNIYVDNADANCTKVGTWAESTSNPNFYGTNYIHDSGTLKGEKRVTFTPAISNTGFYNVYEWHTAGTNRDSNVPIDISTMGSTYTVYVDQQSDDGVWVLLGRYYFEAGTNGTVTIKNEGTTEVVIADAIRFEWDGCEGNIPPVASFTTPVTTIPSGTSVIFKNNSTNATAYSWSFTGGSPATSTELNPIVSYNTSGTYAASLTAQNGSESSTYDMTITVYDGSVQAFNPKYENRGVWITTNWNLDWPSSNSLSVALQKQELTDILDALVDANFNTVYLQVRSRGDLLYASNIEPWAAALSGLGVDPGYDPMAFAIQEAHNRGLEIHAWMVTYRVYTSATPPSTSPEHVVNAHPTWIKNYDDNGTVTKWLDPGIPEVNEYLLSIVDEMVTNYPTLDGVQFDYIRYPNSDFADDATFAAYGSGWSSKDDWRRNNINQFVYAAYDVINAINPNIKVGSAPIGIYQSTSEFWGWNGYSDIMQDSRDWMSKNKQDYICPQIYWDLSSNPEFDLVATDWLNNAYGKQINTGIHANSLATSKGSTENLKEEHSWIYNHGKSSAKGTWTASEIQGQIAAARNTNAYGQCYYRTEDIVSNKQNILTLLKNNEYQYPALNPPMPWKDNVATGSPQNLLVTKVNDTEYTLTWDAPAAASDGDNATSYIIYKSNETGVDISSLQNIEAFKIASTSYNLTFASAPTQDYYYVVTAIDDGNNESSVSTEVMVEAVDTYVTTMIDDFEIDMGHFDKAVDYSGSTTGIDGSASSNARVTTNAHSGVASLELVLADDASSSSNWKVRLLSGTGAPANNVAIPANAKIQLWMATSTANAAAQVYLWVDDTDGIEQSVKANVISNGSFVLYQWDLADATVWTGYTGNGTIDGSTVTIDAIMLEAPNASSNWTLYIDDVAYATGEADCQTPSLTQIIMDNSDASLTGSWATSTSNPNYYATNYIHDSGVLKGEKEVSFTTNIEYDGYYEVFEWHTAGTNRSYDTPVEINGISTVCVNQQVNDGSWVSLGTHFFAAGTGEVVVKNENTQFVTIADAIKLEYASCDADFVTLNVPETVVVGVTSSYSGLASSNVDRVSVEVDGYQIANETVANGAYSFSYSFNVTGTPREFVANAYDASDNVIASLTQHKTVYATAPSMEEATGMEESDYMAMAIYPNPTRTNINIELGMDNISEMFLQLFDARGRLLKSQQINTNTATISLDNLQKGVYILKISGNQFTKTTRVVKE